METTTGTPSGKLPTPEELAALAQLPPDEVRDRIKSLPFVRDWGARGLRGFTAFLVGAAIQRHAIPQAFADYAGNYLTAALTGGVAYAGVLLRDKVAATPAPPLKWLPVGVWNVVRKLTPYLPL